MADDDLSSDDLDALGASDAPPSTGSFATWFQEHQRALFIIGGVTLVLTVWLLFRKAGPNAPTSASTPSGPPAQPGMTSDTASALNQQTTLLESLANAVSNLQSQPQPVTGPNPVGQWWTGLLKDTSGSLTASSNPGGVFTLPRSMTPQQVASEFGLPNGWTDIAYNPYNAAFLPGAYAAQGGETLAAGTQLYIPTSALLTTQQRYADLAGNATTFSNVPAGA